MNGTVVYKTILTILSIGGILTSIWLVYNEIMTPGFCPRLLHIPACYLVLISFILVLAGIHFKGNPTSKYYSLLVVVQVY